ncbi:hypothetical protein TSUD_129620 [Trifolium subterraneum]|uniref:Ubiquitin-like domain-containing protein n=1 Tax=Trifolium subterraneum TaxID=3900 RepID=A0A2Z6MHC4_TRISU|nr:hypothetical protein TSUD_129620 [Trifolium subterraneum]
MQSTIASKDEGMKPTEQDTYIELTIQTSWYGDRFIYRMKRSDQLKKAMTDYCDKNSRELGSVIFLFGRGHSREDQTPNELHMKDGDIIVTSFRYGRHINLKIKGQDGYEASFEMHFDSRLENLMDYYCRKYSLEVTEVAFLFNGRLLRADQTPWQSKNFPYFIFLYSNSLKFNVPKRPNCPSNHIEGKGKFGFLTGDMKKPEEGDPIFRQWKSENSLIIA